MTELASARPPRAAADVVDRALDRASAGRAIPGNAVTHLTDGPRAFAAMSHLIEDARRWIHFENYIIRNDRTGRVFADQLTAAARRGVRVRVLYDHFGCRGTSRRYWRRLRDAGVEVRPFNRVNPFRPLASLRRDHRKYVAADGTRAVVGGICIGDEWAGQPERGQPPWRDTAVEICGPAVPALEVSFVRLWREAADGEGADVVPLRPEVCGGATVRVVDGIPGRVRLYRTMEFLFAAALDRVWVTDAYLVAPTPLYRSLIAAAQGGVDVRILVPGVTDIPAIRALTRVGYRELMHAGARIWEYRGPMLHAKTVLVDDVWFKVGSSNLNPSSLFGNYELDLLIADRAGGGAAAHQFRRDLGDAVEIVLRRAQVPKALADRLPARVVPTAQPGARPHVALRRRAASTLRQVAGAARRSIAGSVMFAFLGAGILLVALPRIMAYGLALVSFALAAVAAWHVLERRSYRRG